MPDHFTHTLRSIDRDSYFFSLTWLTIALFIFLAWLLWFSTDLIVLYRTGNIVRVAGDETLSSAFVPGMSGGMVVRDFRTRRMYADFPISDINRLTAGQKAFVRFKGSLRNQFGNLAGRITRVIPRPGKGVAETEILVKVSNDFPSHLPAGTAGYVQVAVERVTPAVILFRATGLGETTPEVSLGPHFFNYPDEAR